MAKETYDCDIDGRREKIIKGFSDSGSVSDLNGIDYIEFGKDSTSIMVRFFKKLSQPITIKNIAIDGGRQIRNIGVKELDKCAAEDDDREDCLKIKLDKAGDFSTYTLRLVNADPSDKLLQGFDPRYDHIDFSFSANCPSDIDCRRRIECPPKILDESEISYLAKDYSSFRQFILDRLALIMPDWKETHAPDLGIALIELLAYVGDYLSYYQDAVATEAYLGTCRQRISLKRHVRLIDYVMHEGCNSRTFMFVEAMAMQDLNLKDIFFITSPEGTNKTPIYRIEDLEKISPQSYQVFEPIINRSEGPLDEPSVRGAASIVSKLKSPDAEDEVSRCIRCMLSAGTLNLLNKYEGPAPSQDLLTALIKDINRLIGLGIISRDLLENAYPAEISSDAVLTIYPAHNEIHFYRWGDSKCCLSEGSTKATILDGWVPGDQDPSVRSIEGSGEYWEGADPIGLSRALNLKRGDILIFEEMAGPDTGSAADADPNHRHAVRLVNVVKGTDPLITVDVPGSGLKPTPVLEIEWDEFDALPFPLCISSITEAPDCKLVENISIARGNVILVDNGRSIGEDLGSIPQGEVKSHCVCRFLPVFEDSMPARFCMDPSNIPLTFAQPVIEGAPAMDLLIQDPRSALPQIWLLGIPQFCSYSPLEWNAVRDLLGSNGTDRQFVVEIDNKSRAKLRFGDGKLGKAPEPGTDFEANYRFGNGKAGNVGPEAISSLVFLRNPVFGAVKSVRNPMAAIGGTDPEPMEEVKLFAPAAFRKNIERGITAEDYAKLAESNPRIQKAAASICWIGSWYEVQVAVDPRGTSEVDESLLAEVGSYLEQYLRIGYDLRVTRANYVPISLGLRVCIAQGYLRDDIRSEMLNIFSNRQLQDGSLGLFHPDRLSFGQDIHLSDIVATAQSVTGVVTVTVTKLERLGAGPNMEIQNGLLKIGPLEIARLDNDPASPQSGLIALEVVGGS